MEKLCPSCSETKDVSAFGMRRRNKDGLRECCKECHCKQEKDRRNSDIEAERSKQHARYHAPDGEVKRKQRGYVLNNIDKVRKWGRDNYHSHRAARREEQKRYSALNSEVNVARAVAWKKRNPGAVNENTARRYASKTGATPKWSDAKAMKAIYIEAREFRENGLDVQVDHIVPLRSDFVCGLHVPANLRVILATHNQLKNNKFWPDMAEGE